MASVLLSPGVVAGGAAILSCVVLAQALGTLAQISEQEPSQIPAQKVQEDYEYALLSQAVYKGKDQLPVLQRGWARQRLFLHRDQPGYRAGLYENQNTNELVLAYSGTDDFVPPWDWYANLGQGLFGGTKQYRHAIRDAEEVVNAYRGRQIHFTGHSLGGGLASAAAMAHNRHATTFNAAGVAHWTVNHANAEQLIDAYRVQGDILSTLQDAILFGWLGPNGNGRPYYLHGTSTYMLGRHYMDDVLTAMRGLGAQ